MMSRILALLLFCAAANAMAAVPAAACEGKTPRLLDAQFTSAIRGQRPADRLLYLPAGTREVFVHARTSGSGKLLYRWFQDGRRRSEVGADVGNGEWNTWSRLRLPSPAPGEVRVEIRTGDGCLLRSLTLAASALAAENAGREAWAQLARGDATGAKITLKIGLESWPANSAQARAAQRMLDVDVAIGQALERARAGDIFLVEESLRQVERRLGNRAADRAARDRIDEARRESARQRALLEHEGNMTALALRHLLETEKLFEGDYPLLREDAEKVVTPALVYAGNHFTMIDWQPTLRGYRLRIQDKRTGDGFEVMPD